MRRILQYSFVVLLVHFSARTLVAQSNEYENEIITQRIEELSAGTDSESDFSELYEHFSNLLENPVCINTASREELRALLFLNENQIAVLLAERKRRGAYKSVYELKDLGAFYVDLVLMIKPFISFEESKESEKIRFSKLLDYGNNQVIIRYGRVLENQKGYEPISDSMVIANPNSCYLGGKNKIYFRYRYNYRDRISLGVLGDKDAGEEFFKGNNTYGFDFYSAHFFLKNQGELKALAIGDYHLEFGQGLSMWSGLAFGKSATAINIQRKPRGVRPNTSANEALYLRGLAATYRLLGNIEFTAFYSGKKIDASINTRDTGDFVVTSILESGLHRTYSEVSKKELVNEQLFGANISYRNKGLQYGLTSYKVLYSNKIQKDLAPYEFYNFQGKENFNVGTDISYANRYLSAFGEFAMSANGGKAFLTGAFFNLHPRFMFTTYYRNFQQDYQNLYAIPVSEGGKPQNEEGFYFGGQMHLENKGTLRFYYDIFKFPWLRYRVNSPSWGNEFSLQYERSPRSNLMYYFRYQYEERMLNAQVLDDVQPIVASRKRHNLRFYLTYLIDLNWKIRSNLSLSQYQHLPQAQSRGYLLYQDVQYSLQKVPISFSFRYAVFNTDDYNTRIYAYEHDVLYKFSVPAYYYRGQRYYLLINYKISRALTFWLRFSQTTYANLDTVGSGLEEIDGSTKSEITFQLRWKL